eukprot:15301937-Alexandrium_andersonii.AAC.1
MEQQQQLQRQQQQQQTQQEQIQRQQELLSKYEQGLNKFEERLLQDRSELDGQRALSKQADGLREARQVHSAS